MTQRMSQFVASSIILLVCSSLIGGCPLVAESDTSVLGQLVLSLNGSTAELPTAPGSYFVEEFDDGVFFMQLAASRAVADEWIELDDVDAWFAGAGLYKLAADGNWSPAENFDTVSLDDLIQTHDPAPTVESSLSDAELQVLDPVRDPGT